MHESHARIRGQDVDEQGTDATGWSTQDEAAAAGATTANLVAIAVSDPLLAQEGLLAAMRLVRKGHLKLEDAAIIAKEEGGKVRIQETRDTTTVQGAVQGSWWGLLGGLLVGGPVGLAGIAIGAAAGGIFAKMRDIGIQDEQMQQLGEELAEGEAALLLLVEEAHVFHAVAELRRFAGRLLHTTCDDQNVERITGALSTDPWAPVQ